MAKVFDLGFSPSAPTPQELDALPSRLAQVQGIAKGTTQTATGAIQSLLLPVQATALQASDALQTVLEDNMTAAKYVAAATEQHAQAFLNDQLQPVRDIAQKFVPPAPKKRRGRSNAGSSPSEAPAPSLPAPPPGCSWVMPPPGSTTPPRLVCTTPQTSLPAPAGVGASASGGTSAPSATPIQVLTFTVLFNCSLGEVAAVPGLTSQVELQLASEGWERLTGYAPITSASPAMVQGILSGIMAQVSGQCQQG